MSGLEQFLRNHYIQFIVILLQVVNLAVDHVIAKTREVVVIMADPTGPSTGLKNPQRFSPVNEHLRPYR